MTTLTQPWVYAWPQSVVAGDNVAVRAAGPPAEAEVRIHRVGLHRELVWSGDITIEPHDLPEEASSSGCPWPDSATIEVPTSWRSGYYEVGLSTRAGFGHETVGYFVVRAPVADSARPLMVLTTNTWNAYNDFGGRNLYSRGTRVSFARPMAPGYLRKPDGPGSRVAVVDAPDHAMRAYRTYLRDHQFSRWAGSAGWPNAELHFVRWAEESGYEIDYAVNADLEMVPGLLEGRRLYLSVGHDEYWSWAMRDAVESFVRAGGNAVFLSGNTSFWQVRLEDEGATMIGYKDQFKKDPVYGTDQQHLLTSMWSDHLIERPENHMTGVSFSRGGYHRIGKAVGAGAGGYTVYRPEHWIFEGTDTVYGDVIGAAAVTVGYECDGCDLTMRDGLPYPTGSDGTPADFEILGMVPARPFGRDNDPQGVPERARSECEFIAWRVLGSETAEDVARFEHGHALMGVHQPGGTVFTAGTTEWAWGLAHRDPTIERITRNLIDRLSA
ncbi:MAG: N,N-dimethylformamidase beta subunit family domain-containing protein [Acidimicrobiales bacterium]